jgi:hypothetical protein
VGILQYNPIQLAILQDLIGQFPATELDYIVVCPQCDQGCSMRFPKVSFELGVTFGSPMGSDSDEEGMKQT